MSNPNNEPFDGKAATAQNPPPYSEKQPPGDPILQQPSAVPVPPMGYRAVPAMPTHNQPYYVLPGAAPNQGPSCQPLQAVFITATQPVNEPDYLAYSIFTMLCCCLPIGIASLVFSIQTREANRAGNAVSAQRNSQMARTLAHTALGVGLGFLILYIAIVVIVITTSSTYYYHNP